jgi:two-component system, cell cycle sensor histidine kinase PleC
LIASQSTPEAAPGIATRIRVEMIAVLMRMGRQTLYLALAAMLLLCAVHWPMVPQWQPVVLLVAFAAATAGYGWLFRAFAARKPSDAASLQWAYAHAILSGISGGIWGAAGWFFGDPGSGSLLTALVLMAMASGTVVNRSLFLPSYYAYVVPLTLPMAVASFWHGTPDSVAIGTGSILYATGLVLWAHSLNRAHYRALSLGHENAELIEELSAARHVAETANRTKSLFLAQMSHELRTPLNAINGFSEIIREQIVGPIGEPRYVEYAGLIHTAGRHLLNLINDLLDLSKIEAGKMELEPERIDVTAFTDGCLDYVREAARTKHIALGSTNDDASLWFQADARLAKQALLNLLSNALKYTPEGGKVTVTGKLSPLGGLEIAVVDTGIGMSAADLDRAFEPFGQVNHEVNRVEKGTGLGLPLVRSLLELHRGTLRIRSTPARGTEAILWFPEGGCAKSDGDAGAMLRPVGAIAAE